jgi:hypothetical protein
MQITRSDARHAQLAEREPQRHGHLRLLGQRPEVGRPFRQLEQEPHDERRTEALLRWIDSAFDEKGRAHPECDVERRHKAQVGPVGPFAGEPVPDRAARGVRRHEHPLGARRMRAAEVTQVGDEGIHGASQD